THCTRKARGHPLGGDLRLVCLAEVQAEIAIVRSVIPLATCSAWLALVDAAYRRAEFAPSSEFVPESSSFRLRAVNGVSVVDIWSALSSHTKERCIGVLGPPLAIDADQCWVRRQYP